MRATRAYLGGVAVGGLLVALAVLLQRPIFLVGAASVGAWLLAVQYRFARDVSRTATDLDVWQSASHELATVDESVQLVLSATRSNTESLALSIRSDLPVATTTDPADRTRTLHLAPDQREARLAFTVAWPIAGAFEIPPPTVVASDRLGLLREEFPLGTSCSIAVEPRGPRNVHVGVGGEEIATAFGEHPAGRLGSGLDPAELREYVPGDSADRIDWKATARLAEPFVRKYEAETDRRTAMIVDHRESMAAGPEGETPLDYVRQAALAFVASARELGDPIGCYAVGDAGITAQYEPGSTSDQYVRVRSLLHGLTPTRGDDANRPVGRTSVRAVAQAHAAASALEGDDSAFATTLRPFLADARPYVRRLRGDPLFETARTAIAGLRGTLWTAIFTDDTRRRELRETVKLARRGDDHVLVFVAPTILFDTEGPGDLETAYEGYVEFEEFRRDLARLPRVHAFEVGPGDRLAAVLATGRDRRERRVAAGGG